MIAIWLAGIVAGSGLLQAYKATPGTAGTTPRRYPAATDSESPRSGYLLLMFLHPRCPCSRASLTELATILAHPPNPVQTQVWFVRPAEVAEGWERTSLWATAAALPGVEVRCDSDGVLARRLGARTSGHVLLYDPQGHLLFSGGITRGRGHEGDNAGRRTLLACLSGKAAEPCVTPVFGCPFASPEDAP